MSGSPAGRAGRGAAAGGGAPAAIGGDAGVVAFVRDDEDGAVPRPGPAGHDRGHGGVHERVGVLLQLNVERIVVGVVVGARSFRVAGDRVVDAAVHVVALVRGDVDEPGRVRPVEVTG